MKKCPVCGTDFEPKNPKGKVCSAVCNTKFWRSKQKVTKIQKDAIAAKEKADKEVEETKSKWKVKVAELPQKPKFEPTEPKPGSMAYFLKYGKME